MLFDLLTSKIKARILKEILALCVIVLVASLLGYLVETVWVFLRHGYIDNRGMHMPFLLGYGLANLAVFLLFGPPTDPHPLFAPATLSAASLKLLYLAEIFVAVTVCESAFGNLVYRLSGVEWWNYSSIPLHIGQYTSVPTSIGFTACIYVFLDRFFVPLYDYLVTTDIEQYGGIILFVTLMAVIDCTAALRHMVKYKCVYTSFRIKLHHLPELLTFRHSRGV